MNRILIIVNHFLFKKVPPEPEIKQKIKHDFDFDSSIDTDNLINYSFITQHGRKKRILPLIFKKFPDYERFIEGFCGTLSVSLYDNRAEEYHCNDGNDKLIKVFNEIKNLSKEDYSYIIEQISNANKEKFFEIKENINNLKGRNFVAGMIILRNFSFLSDETTYRPIKNTDVYSIEIAKRIKFAQEKMKNKKFYFYNQNIFDFLENFTFKKNDFLYLDPPYIGTKQYKGSDKWTENSLEKLIDLAKRKKVNFAVSERHTPEIVKIAKKYSLKINPVKEIQHIYTRTKEILLTNY